MGLVNPTQSNPGDTIEADDINTPVNQIAAVVNGNIETVNLASNAVTAAKIADGSVSASKIDFGGSGSGVWWQEIARTTLASAADTISATGFTAKKYLHIIIYALNTGVINANVTFNNDTGANYANRTSNNGGGDTTSSSQTSLGLFQAAAANPLYILCEAVNFTASEKLIISQMQESANGAGNPPGRLEAYGKWANTAAQITTVTVTNTGAGDYASGSQLIVLGHD